MQEVAPYQPKNKVRIVTAASLFDGHDAAINIMRRIIQATGCEVIHLGHDRSVEEVVNTAIQEDAQAIAMTSYQGGHNEYFKYMYDLLNEKGAGHIKIFGGGGGVILPEEIKDLIYEVFHFLKNRHWKKKLLTIEGEEVSLNDIEHRILRPIWRDPRIHYAVNCASIGCPNLVSTPFTAENTEALLDQGARNYINHPRAVNISSKGKVTVSSIYSWFESDFN